MASDEKDLSALYAKRSAMERDLELLERDITARQRVEEETRKLKELIESYGSAEKAAIAMWRKLQRREEELSKELEAARGKLEIYESLLQPAVQWLRR